MNGPGKTHRKGMTLLEIAEMFPDEGAANEWFEGVRWAGGRHCGHCGSTETKPVPNAKPMPYWCKSCRSYFSVRTGTVLQRSRVPLRKWAIAIYLEITSLKSVSSMKLHRDIGVTQATAWFMQQRIREAWIKDGRPIFSGPVEADETYMGGKRKNMSRAKRKELRGRGSVGKAIVVGTKDRPSNKIAARHVRHGDSPHLAGFVAEHAELGATVYTDEAKAYIPLNAWYGHESVNHGVGEYVRRKAHTNGIESFWATFKRAHMGTFHKLSPKHLDRYVQAFAGKHNVRDRDTIDQMRGLVAGMAGKRLQYRELIADNGLESGARS